MITYTNFFTTIFFVFVSVVCCLGQDVTITNQADLDAFDPNTTVINGYLYIDAYSNTNPIIDLSNLSNLVSVSDFLTIANSDFLTNIDGLFSLTSIGGELRIYDNDALTSIEGLSNLTSIGGYLDIYDNDLLTSIDGLSNLTSMSEYLLISNNNALTSIDALSNLNSINGLVIISNNDALINIDGLSNLTSIDGYLHITGNSALTNIDGLFNLASIDGELRIQANLSLGDCCGIQNLLNSPGLITGTISVINNPSECSSESQILNAFCGLPIKIFNDINQNCNEDNNEFGVANRMFIIEPGNIVGETSSDGYWSIDYLPLGDYTITIDTSGTWSPTCIATQSFTVIDPIEGTIMPTFGLVSTEPCTAPDISIHMPFMRPCFENQRIHIRACNTYNATGVLENAYIILELDPLLIPTSSLIPFVDLGDNMYQFDIGTLNPGICSEFWMETTLSCDAVLGQSLCMEANLFPAADCVFDDIPNPFPPEVDSCSTDWDMSFLTIKGICVNDSIFFEIINSGSGDMTCFSPVRIYINGNLIISDSVQLASGEVAVFAFSADGQSWRLEVDQHPLHSGNSQPNVVIEGCGETVDSSLSFINAMYIDDADPVVDIYCGIVTGSYDPNDKTGFPLGVNESNDILPNQEIEYLIRFQNTGTDTAFTVVIRDTLSTDFNIFSVQSGVASHSYDFEIYGSRIMQWTFNNILLVDSITNEPDSHGFIKFKVNQIPDLSEGTILKNNAGIYFDFNDPIITNTSEHTINYFTADFVTTNIVEEACDSYASPSGNNIWTNTGTYYDVIETENGDSIIIVDLVLTTASIMGTGGSTLVANIPGAEYQWLDCNNNLAAITGATNQEFIATETIGDYAVQITLDDGCQVVSDCYNLNTTGTEDHELASSVSIHPNPTSNYVSVDLGRSYQRASFTLRNILGQIIFKKNVDNTNEFQFEINGASGLYLFQIETEMGEYATFKILKK